MRNQQSIHHCRLNVTRSGVELRELFPAEPYDGVITWHGDRLDLVHTQTQVALTLTSNGPEYPNRSMPPGWEYITTCDGACAG